MKKLLLILLCLPMIGFGQKKSKKLKIGDYIYGGVIFYLDSTSKHGLVCDIKDLGEAEWGCYGVSISGADGKVIGTGNQNTIDIINECKQNKIAAEICFNSTAQGYSDWFLPSVNELYQIQEYKSIINSTANTNSGNPLFGGTYLSSTEVFDNKVQALAFELNMSFRAVKNVTYRVRAIRAF